MSIGNYRYKIYLLSGLLLLSFRFILRAHNTSTLVCFLKIFMPLNNDFSLRNNTIIDGQDKEYI